MANSIPVRSDPNFASEIKDMQLRRQEKFPKEKLKPTRTSRITLAMTRHPNFKQIKQDIINADLK